MPSSAALQKQVFCIDDDPEMLKLFEMFLETMGPMQVHSFTDAYTAMDALRSAKPDLILLDVMMPEMNGITAYHQIRAIEKLKTVPVIFVTARTRVNDLAQYKELGVPMLPKPFNFAEFQNVINQVLPAAQREKA
jgi:CheY-like chemotaxis protein